MNIIMNSATKNVPVIRDYIHIVITFASYLGEIRVVLLELLLTDLELLVLCLVLRCGTLEYLEVLLLVHLLLEPLDVLYQCLVLFMSVYE